MFLKLEWEVKQSYQIKLPWISTKLSQGEGPLLVDYNESDGKVNQIYIAILGYSYISFWSV